MKRPKIRTVFSTGTGSIPASRNNIFLDLHKMDYYKKRLQFKIDFMEDEIDELSRRVRTIDKNMTSALSKADLGTSIKKGKPSNKLKY